MNLLEQYKQRLDVSDKYFQNTHNGQRLDGSKKLAIATCLNNINKFMNEGFDGGAATQKTDLGNWKKFCLNITTLGVPNTIASELVITQPMTSYTGFIAYTDFVAGDSKGGISAGDLLNGTFGMGASTDERMRYTAARVVERIEMTAGADHVNFMWQPVVAPVDSSSKHPDIIVKDTAGNVLAEGTAYTIVTDADGNIGIANGGVAYIYNVSYIYDNVVIPQNNLVHLKAVQHGIALKAKCRRIAITYSQIAQFQAKTDYNMDLNQQLVAQASGELAYEIDSEVIDLLDSAAQEDSKLNFSRTLPVGVSMREHYDSFSRVIAQAQAIVYGRTQKYQPNYMICAADCLDVLSMNSQWNPANVGAVYGPYFAGTFGSLKVFVSPMLDAGKFIIGVNGNDLSTSAAVYAPYMPVLPTQLLGLPDGTMTQGFCTLYDLQLLARCTFDSTGKMVISYDSEGKTIGDKSPLLVAGTIS